MASPAAHYRPHSSSTSAAHHHSRNNSSVMTLHSPNPHDPYFPPSYGGGSPLPQQQQQHPSASIPAAGVASRHVLAHQQQQQPPPPATQYRQNYPGSVPSPQQGRPVFRTETSTYRDHFCDEEQPFQPYTNPQEYARLMLRRSPPQQQQQQQQQEGVWGAESPIALPLRRAPPHLGKPRSRIPSGYIYKSTNFMNDAPSHVQVVMGFRFGPEPPLPAKVTQYSPWKPLDAQDPLPTLDRPPPPEQSQQQEGRGIVSHAVYPQEPDHYAPPVPRGKATFDRDSVGGGGKGSFRTTTTTAASSPRSAVVAQLDASLSASSSVLHSPSSARRNHTGPSVAAASEGGTTTTRPEMTSLLVEVDERLHAMGVARGITEIRYASDKALMQLLQSLNFTAQECEAILDYLQRY